MKKYDYLRQFFNLIIKFAVGGFDANNVKSIEVDLRDKAGAFYSCRNFENMTPNGASCQVTGSDDHIIACDMSDFGQLNLWFGCDGINGTLGETEYDQPSIWESAVSCDHYSEATTTAYPGRR